MLDVSKFETGMSKGLIAIWYISLAGSSDGRSASSSSGSRGTSRTPSPFGLPLPSSVSSSAASTGPSLAHTTASGYGGSGTPHMLAEKGMVSHKAAPLALPVSGGAPHSEIYSRKVFVGGLPPDIDQGI